MYTVESLELALRGLYHFGIVDGNDQQTDDATEMDVLLEELDFPQELIVNLTKERFDNYLKERNRRIQAISN